MYEEQQNQNNPENVQPGEISETTTESSDSKTPDTTNNTTNLKKSVFNIKIIAAVVVTAAVLFFVGKSFVVATANNSPVFIWDFYNEMKTESGEKVLESLLTRKVIRQEARKTGVSVQPSEVEKEYNRVAESADAQGQDLEALLTTQGLDIQSFKDQLELQLLIRKMLADKVTVTDEEIDSKISENADQYKGEDTTTEKFREDIRYQLETEKLNNEVQPWIDKIMEDASVRRLINF